MIQDIAPKIFYNCYALGKDEKPCMEETLFFFGGRNILLHKDENGNISFPTIREAVEAGFDPANITYLFKIDDRKYYLYKDFSIKTGDSAQEQTELIPGFSFGSIRELRSVNPKLACFAGMTAFHLYVWYRDNQFCGRCGGKTIHSETERAMFCPACRNTIYPKICPAVIVGVIKGDSILMTRYAGKNSGVHALVAGFAEIGETAEECVQREVMEEVGLHVKNIRYFATQPWGFESDLLLGYYCDAADGEEIQMDENELSRAVFVKREDLGEEPSDLSLTATMIMHFKNHENV